MSDEEEPTTFQPPPPPEAEPPAAFRSPAYEDEQTFFPPPPEKASPPSAPVAPPPPGPPTSQPPAPLPSQAPPTIDPLLQYRGEPSEDDYRQQPPPTSRRPSRRSRDSQPRQRRSSARFWIQLAAMIGVILLAVVMLRVFVFESFYITSDSMASTLKSGDRVIVNKLSSGSAGRGDIVVFNRPATDPTDSNDDLVKRVVALEDETIIFSQGRVFIGELLLVEPYLPEGSTTDGPAGNRFFDACVNQTSANSCTVAPGHVYVLGDSRNFSFDSRFFGPVPKNSIVGGVVLRVWPIGDFGGI